MNTTYKLRVSCVFFVFCVAYLIILANVYRIQIREHAFFIDLAHKQYSTVITTLPPRAPIIDRTGTHFFAINKETIAAFIMPPKLANRPAVEQFLAHHFPAAEKKLRAHPNTPFMYIDRRLADEQIELIKASGLEDIHLLCEPNRFYPIQSAAPIIGTTNIDNKGIFGLELLFDKQLTGKSSTALLQKDARSGHFYFQKDTQQEGYDGTPLQLTIDGNLQFLVHEELKKTIEKFGAKEGSVVVMNPRNGEILAMVSEPAFDPNDSKHLDLEHTKNRVISEVYELGSVMKAFAALAAFEEGVVTPDELVDCENVWTTYIDGRRVNTIKSSVLGIVPFCQVIEKSNNIGIAKITKRVDTKLYNYYKRFGFGKKTGIEFPGERDGFINPPERWSKQSIFSLSYGYEISSTILQLARAFSIIFNGGYEVTPTLVMGKAIPIDPTRQERIYSEKTLTTLREILQNVVLRGSGKKAQIEGYTIMGKTGTANILINGAYVDTKNIYTYAGLVEKGDYQRVIVTFIKEASRGNLYASMVAAPLFEQVAEKVIINDKII